MEDKVRAAMMNDLGIGRLEDLARDDEGDRQHRDFRQLGDARISPSTATQTPANVVANPWMSAVAAGAFNDDDAHGVAGLDSIANGRLHAQRRDWPAAKNLVYSTWKPSGGIYNHINPEASNHSSKTKTLDKRDVISSQRQTLNTGGKATLATKHGIDERTLSKPIETPLPPHLRLMSSGHTPMGKLGLPESVRAAVEHPRTLTLEEDELGRMICEVNQGVNLGLVKPKDKSTHNTTQEKSLGSNNLALGGRSRSPTAQTGVPLEHTTVPSIQLIDLSFGQPEVEPGSSFDDLQGLVCEPTVISDIGQSLGPSSQPDNSTLSLGISSAIVTEKVKETVAGKILEQIQVGVDLSRECLVLLSKLKLWNYQDICAAYDEMFCWVDATGLHTDICLSDFSAVLVVLIHLGRHTSFKSLDKSDQVKSAAVVLANLRRLKMRDTIRYDAAFILQLKKYATPRPPVADLLKDLVLLGKYLAVAEQSSRSPSRHRIIDNHQEIKANKASLADSAATQNKANYTASGFATDNLKNTMKNSQLVPSTALVSPPPLVLSDRTNQSETLPRAHDPRQGLGKLGLSGSRWAN
ncbi:hypothetical protein BX600DRAFT_548425 [Xylariales sp. PMI_506]|nr:hypothetical protein BX600DRAFT_548425 [Xylariales sp. PMI_506]